MNYREQLRQWFLAHPMWLLVAKTYGWLIAIETLLNMQRVQKLYPVSKYGYMTPVRRLWYMTYHGLLAPYYIVMRFIGQYGESVVDTIPGTGHQSFSVADIANWSVEDREKFAKMMSETDYEKARGNELVAQAVALLNDEMKRVGADFNAQIDDMKHRAEKIANLNRTSSELARGMIHLSTELMSSVANDKPPVAAALKSVKEKANELRIQLAEGNTATEKEPEPAKK